MKAVMAGSTCDQATGYLERVRRLSEKLDAAAVDRLAAKVFEAWRQDRLVLLMGNGGSAFNASHWVADLVKTAMVPGQRRLRAMSLVDNFGLTTALGNDIAYEQTLDFGVETYGRAGDVAIAMSCSGTSPNAVRACELAKKKGLWLACLTGPGGGKMAPLADLHIEIADDNYGIIEDAHMMIGHMVSQQLHDRVRRSVA